jgi:hypothetical protein
VTGVPVRRAAPDTPFEGPVLVAQSGPATDLPATTQQIVRMEERLNAEPDAGALGIGMGIQYTPGATRLEVIDMFRLAAMRGVPVLPTSAASADPNPARASKR